MTRTIKKKKSVKKLTTIHARQVFDSRGNPTVEVEVAAGGLKAKAMVPSGASTGIHEAVELRDDAVQYNGKGVLQAVDNVNTIIAKALKGIDPTQQKKIDNLLLKLDGTTNKGKLGANALLGVSMACARLGALCKGIPLYEHISKLSGRKIVMPIPFANIINGGEHAGNKLTPQEFMIVPTGASSFTEATQIVTETYHLLKKIIAKQYGKEATSVGDEGGFAPPLDSFEEALDLIMEAIKKSGWSDKLKIALDPAASEFYVKKHYDVGLKILRPSQLVDHYRDLFKKYPIVSVEDPFEQDDFESFKALMQSMKGMKQKPQIVGDDLTVTNVKRIRLAAKEKLCNALLLKVNQIGTITESIDAALLAFKHGWNVMVSHRSGETEDPFIADMAVGLGSGQIKLGAPCRSDRVAKYNQLLRIEEALGKKAKYNKIFNI